MVVTSANKEYELLEEGKVKCLQCGSIVNKTGYSGHKKTLKHSPDNKGSVEHIKLRENKNNRRTKDIETFGLEVVQEKERLKKRKQRAKPEAESDTKSETKSETESKTPFIDPKSLITNLNVEYKTLKGYIGQLARIYKGVSSSTWNKESFKWLNSIELVSNYIENSKLSDGTKRNQFNSIYSILSRLEGYEEVNKEYFVLKNKYAKLVDDKRGENILTEKESKNIMPWSKILEYKNNSWTPQDTLLFKLYTCLPPRRLKDYQLLKYIKVKSLSVGKTMDTNYNYILVNKRKNPFALIINNYKTKKVYGQYVVDLYQPDNNPIFRYTELKKAIKDFSKHSTPSSGDLVFPNTQGDVQADFTGYLNNIFKNTGKKISANLLRHMFSTDFIKNNPNASDNTLKVLAKASGNSLEMFRSYRKIKKD